MPFDCQANFEQHIKPAQILKIKHPFSRANLRKIIYWKQRSAFKDTVKLPRFYAGQTSELYWYWLQVRQPSCQFIQQPAIDQLSTQELNPIDRKIKIAKGKPPSKNPLKGRRTAEKSQQRRVNLAKILIQPYLLFRSILIDNHFRSAISLRASTPGSLIPCMYSSDAPPPVDT